MANNFLLTNTEINYAKAIARKYHENFNNGAFGYIKLFRLAVQVLCHTAKEYDHNKHCSFQRFAYPQVRKALFDALNQEIQIEYRKLPKEFRQRKPIGVFGKSLYFETFSQ